MQAPGLQRAPFPTSPRLHRTAHSQPRACGSEPQAQVSQTFGRPLSLTMVSMIAVGTCLDLGLLLPAINAPEVGSPLLNLEPWTWKESITKLDLPQPRFDGD